MTLWDNALTPLAMARTPDPLPALVLTDADAARLQALALLTWSSQGEAEAGDSSGRSWSFYPVREPRPVLMIEGRRALGDLDAERVERAAVEQATLGAEALAAPAVAGALASVAARLAA